MDRYFVHIERGDPSGVVLTVEGLAPLLILRGDRRPKPLTRAREAIAFQASGRRGIIDRPLSSSCNVMPLMLCAPPATRAMQPEPRP
jgi:hypothetical protein